MVVVDDDNDDDENVIACRALGLADGRKKKVGLKMGNGRIEGGIHLLSPPTT